MVRENEIREGEVAIDMPPPRDAGLVAFLLTRRSIFAGVVTGEVFMLAGKWWLG